MIPGHILIVDDNEAVRKGIRTLISTVPGWTVCGEAVDGLDAIEKVKELRPQVVLMDVSMPRMNGLQATHVIRKEMPEATVIIVSQNDPETVKQQVPEVDAAGYVAKAEISRNLVPLLKKLADHVHPQEAENPAGKDATEAAWLSGGGSLGRLIREFDWSKTSLGPLHQWPQSLKTSVSLILNSQHPMWVGWGPEMTFLYNDAYIQVLSKAKHPAALGKPAAEVWAEIWDICGPLADKVYQKGEASFVDDIRLFMNRGNFLEETYYSFSYSPIRDESGRVGGLFCPSTEVTPKVINARRLRTLSELSAGVLTQKSTEAACESAFLTLGKNPDDIPFAVLYLTDAEGKNAWLERICGLPPDITTLAPPTVSLIESEGKTQEVFWPLADVLRTSHLQVVDVGRISDLPVGPAQQKICDAIVLPVTSRGQDKPLGVLIAGVNPTRRLDTEYRTFYDLIAGQIASAIQNVRASEEERKRLEALAEIDRAKTAFFSNVSHEFRTPLTLMLGPVEDLLAKSYTGLSPAAKSQLELVNRNGSRLLRLVNTLLDFSRIEAGRMQAVYQPTDLAGFTVELASVFRSATEKAGLELELNCAKLSQPLFVDRNMWEKIVLNLISNAFKFTFKGKIAVSLSQAGDNVELRVQDTGVGIPQHELPKLFDRFHRIENTRSRTHEGSGIGLALVLELAKLHGGSVRAESAAGKGSTFIVSIPMGSAHLPADRIGKSRSSATTAVGAAPFVEEALRWLPEAEQTLESDILPSEELLPVPCPPTTDKEGAEKRPRVLIADDNADMRHYLVRLLSERFDVIAVANGQAALDAIRNQLPDLILSDVMMPELDGFGLLRELRDTPETRTTPIILLSARAGEESRVEGLDAGADDYLVKPFSARELIARVQTHLQLARVRREAGQAIRDSELKLQLSLKASKRGVFYWYPQEDRTESDQRVLEVFGLSSTNELTLAAALATMIHPEDRDRYARNVARTLDPALDGKLDEEIRVRWADGSEHWLSVTAQMEFTGNPRTAYRMAGLIGDITDRKNIEEAEKRRAAQYQTLLNQAPLGVYLVDGDLRIRDVNPTAARVFGRFSNLIGRDFEEVIHLLWGKKFGDEIVAIFRNTLRTGEPYQNTEWFERRIDRDATEYYEWRVDRIPLPEGGLGVVCYFRDISEQVRARVAISESEERFRKLAETLESEVRIRTRELELRNADMVSQSELLRDLSRRLLQVQDEERRRIARELHDSAGQILAALSMNLARLAQQAKPHGSELTDVAEDSRELVRDLTQEIRTMSYLLHPPLLDETGLAEAVRWYIQGLSERNGLEINFRVGEDFGRLTREVELVMFRLVQECLTNIHRHSGSKRASIRIGREDGKIFLQVQDEGKGILPERLAEIQAKGSGVGITGMRERVRQFGGQMEIKSNGRGTTIAFTIPMAAPSPRSPVPQASTA
jgi:PAS domain S-box-containing protein